MPKHINAPTMGNSEVKDFYGSLWFPLSAFFLSTPSDPSVCSHSGSATLPEQIELGFTESPATNFTKSLQLFWNILEHFGDRVQNSSNTFPNLSEPRHPRHNKIPALTSHISQNLPFSACPALVTPSRMSGAVYELSAKLRSWCSSGDFEGGNEKLASEVRKPHVKLVKVVNSPNAEMARPAFQMASCKELKAVTLTTLDQNLSLDCDGTLQQVTRCYKELRCTNLEAAACAWAHLRSRAWQRCCSSVTSHSTWQTRTHFSFPSSMPGCF